MPSLEHPTWLGAKHHLGTRLFLLDPQSLKPRVDNPKPSAGQNRRGNIDEPRIALQSSASISTSGESTRANIRRPKENSYESYCSEGL